MNVEHLESRILLAVDVASIVQFDNPDIEIPGGVSELTRMDDMISVETNATGLVPGDAVTSWWVVFNNPEFCEGTCDGTDLGTPEVEAALFYADGAVVGEDGTATFTASLNEGDVSGVDSAHTTFPAAGIGLIDAAKAEVHFVMRTHGAAFPEGDPLRTEQLTTFNGGCNTECTNVQGVGFNPVNRALGDFDLDSTVSAKDIGLLFLTIGNDNDNPLFDINEDGSVNSADVDELVVKVIGTRRGDSNLDGKVEFEDFLGLASNFRKTGSWSDGDFTGDGMIDFADFLLLSANFGFDGM